MLQKIVLSTLDPMLSLASDGRILFINDSACAILGYTQQDCLGRCYKDLLTINKRPGFMRSAIERGEVPDLFSREDKFFEVEIVAGYTDEDGIPFSLARIKDVTKTYQNQEMLEYLRNDAPLGAFKILMDKYFTTIYATDTFYAIHGFTREEYNIERVGRSANYMPPDDVEVARKALFAAYRAGQKSMAFEMRIIRRDGSHGWLLTQCTFVETVDGPVMYGFVTDNTVVKQQQEELHELERICEFTLNQDYEGVYLINMRAKSYRMVNRKGITRKEILPSGTYGYLIADALPLLPTEQRENFSAQMSLKAVQQALSMDHVYTFLYSKLIGEGLRRMRATFRYYDDTKDKLILCVKDVEDTERQRELMAQVQANEIINQAKSDFLARMSHDIRTPINSIIGSIEIGKTRLDNQACITECLKNIHSASKFLLSLINDLLDMSRLESGKLPLIADRFDLGELLSSLTLLMSKSAEERGVNFRVAVDPSLERWYTGDELRIKQILMNLLSNAIKYSREKDGNVLLSVSPCGMDGDKACLRFVVEDNGIGMSEAFQKRMWIPFEREHDEKRGLAGTGLGLTIVRNLIDLMHGKLNVQSTPNVGSTFTVELPFMRTEQQHTPFATIEDTNALRVLVIDDDLVTCKCIAAIFAEMQIQCSFEMNAIDGIRVAKEAKENGKEFSTVFVDWKMPGMDGIQTSLELRHILGDDAKIVMLSAHDWTSIQNVATAAGIACFVRKPMLRDNVYELLARLTNQLKTLEPISGEMAFSGQKILLAEDHTLNALIAKTLLEQRQLQVVHAANGKEAVELFEASQLQEFSLILMDIRMPVMDGIEATTRIRVLPRADAKTIPIFALSANAFSEDVQKSKACGMQEHLSKPFDVPAMFKLIEQYLRLEA